MCLRENNRITSKKWPDYVMYNTTEAGVGSGQMLPPDKVASENMKTNKFISYSTSTLSTTDEGRITNVNNLCLGPASGIPSRNLTTAYTTCNAVSDAFKYKKIDHTI